MALEVRGKGLAFATAAVLCAMTSAAAAAAPALVEGEWVTDRLTQMTIMPCDQGYCGYISKIVVPEDIRQKLGTELEGIEPADYRDVNNRNPTLRDRPIQGLQILTLRSTATPNYYEGEIYNPEDGKTYAGSVEVMDGDSIRLKGCVLYVLCQDQIWERAEQ